jgi:hypothetical protein
MRLGILMACLIGTPAVAANLPLAWPVDCKLNDTCDIQQYVDRDPGPETLDHNCAQQTYDGHKGTDIRLPDLAAMERGVMVLAAAPGTVRGLRDGMADIASNAPNAPEITGKDCGNGIVVDHGQGWETQYCHLKKGTVQVKSGQKVRIGTPLGEIGLSGRTEFPHLHLSVRKDGQVVDPFAPNAKTACGADPSDDLWDTALAPTLGGILSGGILDSLPKFADIKQGGLERDTLPTNSTALVAWAQFFGLRKGDEIRLTFTGPNGVLTEQSYEMEKDRAALYRAAGKKLRGAGWPKGTYFAQFRVLRNGQEVDSFQTQTRIE